MVKNFVEGGAAVNQLCKIFDADLRVYELGLEQPTSDFTKEPAMTEEECVRAMAYGMMAIEPGFDIICLGEMELGIPIVCCSTSMALFGGTAKDWVGRGTGINSEDFRKKNRDSSKAVELHLAETKDPLSLFAALGGLELAAIVGAIVAARLGSCASYIGWICLYSFCFCFICHRPNNCGPLSSGPPLG